MKRDRLLARLFCIAGALLALFRLWTEAQDLFNGRGANSSILLYLIGLIAAGYLFFHPEEVKWQELGKGYRLSVGGFLFVGGGLFCVVYLLLGINLGYPENWKMLSLVSGLLSVVGFFILSPKKLRKGARPEEEEWKRNQK